MTKIDIFLLGWCGVLTLIGIVLTVWDKRCAKKHRRRVPEKTLLLVGALGGALGMWLTMRCIRHKTRKKRFMWVLPLFFLWHLAVAVALWYLGF